MILIIGATGTVGREVVRQIAGLGVPVRAFTRQADRPGFFAHLPVEMFVGDLADISSLRNAFDNVSKVFIVTPGSQDQAAWERNAAEAAAQKGIQQIVKLSTLGANPSSPSLTARWHGQSEEFIVQSGLPCTFLRCHNFMQNTLKFAPSIARDGVFFAPLGDAEIAMVDVRDIAAVATMVLTEDSHRGRIYRLTGSEAISYDQVAGILTDTIGREVRYRNVSFDEARRRMSEAGMAEWQIDDLIGLYRQFQKRGGARVWDDVEKVTGRKARRFEEFARDYADIFRGDIPYDSDQNL